MTVYKCALHVQGGAILRVVAVSDQQFHVALATRAAVPALRRLAGPAPACYLLLAPPHAARATETPFPDGRPVAREGETGNLSARLAHHMADPGKRGYDRVAALYGPAVTKPVARCLEYLVAGDLAHAGRARPGAVRPPGAPALPPEVWARARVLLASALPVLRGLDLDLLEAPSAIETMGDQPLGGALDEEGGSVSERPSEACHQLVFADFRAFAADAAGGVVLLPGSEIRARAVASGRPSHLARRAALAREGALRPVPGRPDRLRLTASVRFAGLDAAGKFLIGNQAVASHRWVSLDPDPGFEAAPPDRAPRKLPA